MNWIDDFISLVFPNLCISCACDLLKGEKFLCFSCLSRLPYTGYSAMTSNPVKEVFTGRLDVVFATSLLHFEKGNLTQRIMHELKYRGNPEIGRYFGGLIGEEISANNNLDDVDAIIPVPIHLSKNRQRGYNQSDYIAKGISQELRVKLKEGILYRHKRSGTQTRRKRYERWENVRSVFSVQPGGLAGIRHVILVDDVITTGATIEACAQTLLSQADLRISVATLARSG